MSRCQGRCLAFQPFAIPGPCISSRTSRSARVISCATRSAARDDDAARATKPSSNSATTTPKAQGRAVSEISVGDAFLGTVTDINRAESSWVDIGAVTLTGKPIRARLRNTRASKAKNGEVVGGVIPVYVHKVNLESARIEVRKGSFPSKSEKEEEGRRMLDSLQVGQELTGLVVALGQYGAVVDVNATRNGKRGRMVPALGLLPRKSFSDKWASEVDPFRASDAERILGSGDELKVWVKAVHVQNAFLLFDSKEVDPAEMKEERAASKRNARRQRRRNPIASVEPGEELLGVVRRIENFGVFVDVGLKRDGLIHYSEMGERHRRDWMETIPADTKLNVEVLTVDDNRLGLRLISIVDEERADILSRASSATARIEDKEQAKALGKSNRERKGKTAKASEKATVTKSSGDEVKKAGDEKLKAEVVEEEDTSEEVEQFSDEYFEDKYGY